MRQSLRILWNAGTNYAREAVVVGLALVLNPFLFHRLGEEAYGVVALTLGTMTLLYLLDVGMAHAIARFVSRYAALNDSRKVSEVVSTALGLYCLIGLFACIVVGSTGLFWLPALGVPESVLPPARWIVVLMGIALAVRFACYAFEGTLRGLERFDLSNAAYLSERLAYAAGVFLVVGIWKGGLLAVGMCLFGASLLENAIRLIAAFRACRGLQVRWRLMSTAMLKEMLRFGLLASLTQISSFLEKTGTRLMVSIFLGSTVLGFFNLIMVVVLLLLRLATAVNVVVMPVASKLETLADNVRLRQLLFDGSRFVLTLVVPCAVWLIVMAGPLLHTWIGPELAVHAPVLVVMALAQLLDLICGVGNMVLVGSGNVKLLGWTYLVTSLFMIVLLAVLLATTALGMYAVAVAFGLSVLIRRAIILVHMCASVGATVRSYVQQVLLPVCVAGVATAVALIIVRQWLPAAGWGPVLLSVAVAGSAHLLASWLIVLNREDRRRMLALATQTVSRLRAVASGTRDGSSV